MEILFSYPNSHDFRQFHVERMVVISHEVARIQTIYTLATLPSIYFQADYILLYPEIIRVHMLHSQHCTRLNLYTVDAGGYWYATFQLAQLIGQITCKQVSKTI